MPTIAPNSDPSWPTYAGAALTSLDVPRTTMTAATSAALLKYWIDQAARLPPRSRLQRHPEP